MNRAHHTIGHQLATGRGSARPMFGRRRRRRRYSLPAGVALLGLILLPAAWAGRAGGAARAASAAEVQRATTPPPEAAANTRASTALPPVFATHDGVRLVLPNEGALLVGFHEASYPSALDFTPVGDSIANDNRTKFTAPPTDPAGPEYVVEASRGRPQGATSAVDVALRADQPVHAIVDGVVTDVRPYQLYGKYPDTRIEIRPDARPDLRVVLIHVVGVHVAVGDRLRAGETLLADHANVFPFSSQIDNYFDQTLPPHVHIEVKAADAPVPVG